MAPSAAEMTSLKQENQTLKEEMELLSNALAATKISKPPRAAPAPAAPAPPPLVAPPNFDLLPLPAAPAKPASAYTLFCASARPGLPAGMLLPEQTKTLGGMWKAMKVGEAAEFVEKADGLKAAYEVQKMKYDAAVAKVLQERKALTCLYQARQQQVAVDYYHQVVTGVAPAAPAGMAVKVEGELKKEDLAAPKKPKSAYMLFVSDRRAAEQAKREKAGVEEKVGNTMMKAWGEEWAKLQKTKTSQRKIAKYFKQHEEEKVRYAAETETYDAKVAERKAASHAAAVRTMEEEKKLALKMYLPQVQKAEADKATEAAAKESKKAKKAQRALEPKRGKSAYIFFSLAERESVVKAMPEATQPVVMSEIGRRWKEASVEAKAEFVAAAEQDKVRYTAEMAAFNAKKA